jgi:hypothetical protein
MVSFGKINARKMRDSPMMAQTAKRKSLPRTVMWLFTVPELLEKPLTYTASLPILTVLLRRGAECWLGEGMWARSKFAVTEDDEGWLTEETTFKRIVGFMRVQERRQQSGWEAPFVSMTMSYMCFWCCLSQEDMEDLRQLPKSINQSASRRVHQLVKSGRSAKPRPGEHRDLSPPQAFTSFSHGLGESGQVEWALETRS